MNNFYKQLTFIILGVAIIATGVLVVVAVNNRGANPVLWLRLDEGYGANAYDAAGNSNTGAISGDTAWQNEDYCKFGKCLYFDGAGDYITVSDASSLDASTGVTLETWVKPNVFSSTSTLLAKDDAYSLDLSQGMPRFRAYANSVWHTVQDEGSSAEGGTQDWTFREKADGTLTGGGGATFTESFGYRSLTPSNLTSQNGVLVTQSDDLRYSRGSQATPDGTNVVYENFNPNQGTLEFWVRPNWDVDSSTPRHYIFDERPGISGNADRMILYQQLGSMMFNLYDTDGTGHGVAYANNGLWNAGEWHHIVATWDMNNDSMAIYTDGILRDNTDHNLSSDSITAVESNLHVGEGYDNAQQLNGTIAGRILNRPLTAAEVAALYNSGDGHTDTFTVTPDTVWMGTYSDSTTTAAYWHTGKAVTAIGDDTSEDQILTAEGSDNSFTNGDRIVVYDGTGYSVEGCVDGTPTSTNVFIDDCSDGDTGATEDVGVNLDFSSLPIWTARAQAADNTVHDIITEDISISVWVKLDSDAALGIISSKKHDGNVAGYSFGSGTPGKISFNINDGTDSYAIGGTSDLRDDKWHHISAVIDRDNSNNSKLFLDGYDDTASRSGTIGDVDSITTTRLFTIGSNANASYQFRGQIRDVKLYYAAGAHWTDAQVLYQATHPFDYGAGAGTLTDYWRADENTGTTVTGNVNNLTLSNAAAWSQESFVSKNLIPDGSMENGGIGGWTTDPDATTTKDTSVVKFDNQSLKIQNIASEAVYASTSITTADGEDYYFHGWFRTPATVSTSTTLVDVEASSSMSFLVDNLSTSTTAQIEPNTWYEVDFTFQVNDASTVISLGSGSVTASESGYWDNVIINNNLIDNPGLESFQGGDPDIPTGWINHSLGAGKMVKSGVGEVDTERHSGNLCAKFVNSTNINQGVRVSSAVSSLVTNEDYTFSIFAKGSAGGETLRIQLTQFTNNQDVYFTMTTTWTKYSFSFNPGTDAAGLIVVYASSGAGDLYIDDISLIELDTAPASTATASNAANSFGTGKWDDSNGAFLVDGGDTLTYPTSGNISGATGTIAFWIKPNGWDGDDGKYHYMFDTDADRFLMYKGDNSKFSIFPNFTDSSGRDIESASALDSSSFSANTWYHLAVTWDNSADSVVMYLDGASHSTTPTGSGWTLPSFGTNLHIGTRYEGSYKADAFFDDIRIYDTVLTAEEIADLYNGTYQNVINENAWNHLAGVYDKANENIKIYVDGILKNTVAVGGSYDLNNSSDDLIVGNGLTGYMDDIKVYDEPRTASQIRSDFVGGPTSRGASGRSVTVGEGIDASEGLIAHWKFDETALNACGSANDACDSSGNNNHLSAINDAAPTSTAKYGYAAMFDGTGDYYCTDPDDDGDCDADADLDITGEFTFEGWVMIDNNPSVAVSYIANRSRNTSGYKGFFLTSRTNTLGTSQTIVFTMRNDSLSTVNVGWLTSFDWSAWHHIAGTARQVGTSVVTKIYLDGVELDSTITENFSVDISSIYPLMFGRYSYSSAGYFDGQIDDVKIYNVARSASQIRKDYETGPPPVAHWKFDENSTSTAYDTAGSNNGRLVNMATSTNGGWTSGRYGSALQFDGVDDYVDGGEDPALNLSNSGTIAFWFKPAQIYDGGPPDPTLIEFGEMSAADTGWTLRIINGRIVFTIEPSNDGVISTAGFSPNVWHHVTVVKNAGVNSQIYINGVLDNTGTDGTPDTPGASENFNIGSLVYPTGPRADSTFNGKIDDVRIYNYARTQKQIMEDMNAGHPAVGSPVGSYAAYWKFDEGYASTTYDMSLSDNDGTLYGGVHWTQSGKYGSALSFDGENDYVSLGSCDTNNFCLQNHTKTAWVKIDTADSGQHAILEFGARNDITIGGDEEGATCPGSNICAKYYTGSFNLLDSNVSAIAGVWYHVVFVTKEDTGHYLYINGELKDSDSITADTVYATARDVTIGANYGYGDPFNGKIDEVKIYPFALTPEEVKQEYNRGATLQLGALSSATTTYSSNSSYGSYCVPGDTSQCDPPVAHWKMDEMTGSTVYDTAGSNDGDLNLDSSPATSSAWQVTGCHAGSCLEFDGVDDYVEAGNDMSLNITDAITIGAWVMVYASSSNVAYTIISKHYYNYDFGLSVASSNNSVKFYFYNYKSGGPTDVVNTVWESNIIYLKKWVYVAVSITGKDVSFYRNGKFLSTHTMEGDFTASSDADKLYIGLRADMKNMFNGKIDDVRIYDYARTPAQIAWDYNRGGPVGWWKMDEGQDTATTCDATVSTVLDYSGNANHGDLNLDSSPATSSAWSEGKFGCALDFDGSDDYVDISTSDIVPLTTIEANGLTLATWIKFDAGGLSAIVGQQPHVGHDYFSSGGIYKSSNDKAQMTVFKNSVYTHLEGTTVLSSGVWYHIVGIYNASDDKTRIYLNGVLENTSSVLAGNFLTGVNIYNYIGGQIDTTMKYFFNGQIDDVRIYNYALTETQIKNVYNEGSAVRFGPSEGLP